MLTCAIVQFVCTFSIQKKRDGSAIYFQGTQYIYTIGGSHYYVDFKRQINGGTEVSMVKSHRKHDGTDQLTGGHPSGGGSCGITTSPQFLDEKVAAIDANKKGAKIRYTLWVASWSGGTMYLHGYPNMNERSMNFWQLSEIAR